MNHTYKVCIVAAGIDGRSPCHGYVLADRSGRYSPDAWARAAVDLYHELRADWIIVRHSFSSMKRAASSS